MEFFPRPSRDIFAGYGASVGFVKNPESLSVDRIAFPVLHEGERRTPFRLAFFLSKFFAKDYLLATSPFIDKC